MKAPFRTAHKLIFQDDIFDETNISTSPDSLRSTRQICKFIGGAAIVASCYTGWQVMRDVQVSLNETSEQNMQSIIQDVVFEPAQFPDALATGFLLSLSIESAFLHKVATNRLKQLPNND